MEDLPGDIAYDDVIRVKKQRNTFDVVIHGTPEGELKYIYKTRVNSKGKSIGYATKTLSVHELGNSLKSNPHFDPDKHRLRLLICFGGSNGIAEQLMREFPIFKLNIIAPTGEVSVPHLIIRRGPTGDGGNTPEELERHVKTLIKNGYNRWVHFRWRRWYHH